MKHKLILGLLIGVNLALTGLLVLEVRESSAAKTVPALADDSAPAAEVAGETQTVVQSGDKKRRAPAASNSVPSTPFTQMYSQNASMFTANLRGIGCPEETVKDILKAEISRRYRKQEEALRPKPADHVPITWSANPSERKLFQRRQQAAAIAREKAVLLRDALGYEVPVAMPIYALTSSEQRFEDSLAKFTTDKRSAVVSAHEDYWTKVQALRERTRGFWESEDVAELERLKTERRTRIEGL